MTRHTPMSDERLEELRRLVGIGRGVMDLATLDCIAEIYRLRDENKRLRDALERIRDSDDVRDWAQNVAAEALEGQPT